MTISFYIKTKKIKLFDKGKKQVKEIKRLLDKANPFLSFMHNCKYPFQIPGNNKAHKDLYYYPVGDWTVNSDEEDRWELCEFAFWLFPFALESKTDLYFCFIDVRNRECENEILRKIDAQQPVRYSINEPFGIQERVLYYLVDKLEQDPVYKRHDKKR